MNSYNPLLIAVLNNKSFELDNLLLQNQNLEEKFNGKTLLMIAVENNYSYILTKLLEYGAETEVIFKNKTPLIIAVENNHSYNVKKLLEYGAKTEVKFKEKTPLIIAVENNHLYNIEKLLEYGAKTEVRLGGKTPLIVAIQNNNFNNWIEVETINLLLNSGANPNIIDMNSGDSALFIAVKLRNTKIVELLLIKNANIFFRNNDISKNDGKTIFKYIINNNLNEIIQLNIFKIIQCINDFADKYGIHEELINIIIGY